MNSEPVYTSFSFYASLFLRLVIVFAFTMHASIGWAQQNFPNYVLTKGTVLVRGLSFFSPNAIPALYGEYRTEAGAVIVWYTTAPIHLSAAWVSAEVTGVTSARVVFESTQEVYAVSAGSYHLFFRFPARFTNKGNFISAFLDRFAAFKRLTASDADLSFPAILTSR